ncbi:MAG TPA: protein kinase, partial [Pyrinomonadaceae bacterium]|nr:protein kinase [Pyrinomonadaceae bacterium]
ALELPVAERGTYVQQACNGDEALLAEVSSLLSSVESSNGFMEQPALSAGFNVLLNSSQDSLLGKSLGIYKIISPLGQGGMGDVYLAEDTRLHRQVALKFLSMEFVGDNWAKRQLLKEAQSVAMLDHANICQVYGIEDHEERSFIAMQYVKGTTLADLIKERSLTGQEVLALAKQIVSALSEAHAHGIIHRDLKPRNIMVTANQQVKMLDFGLAKTVQRMKGRDLDDSMSAASQAGVRIGTVPYMSPEQLREEKLDYRSDVFSVGIVLYEMLCGKNLFARDNYADTISAILSNDPVLFENCESRTPAALQGVIRKCLERKAEDRYQSATDLLIDLEAIEINGASSKPRQKTGNNSVWTSRLALRAALALSVLLLVSFVGYFIYTRLTRPKSIAVLPIENQTGDPNWNYLSDGLTLTITTKLAKVSKLNVLPATVVAGYKQNVDLKAIARTHHLDNLLRATVVKTGDKQFLNTELFNEYGELLWQQSYPVDMVNVFTIDTVISQNVTSAMKFVSAEDERRINEAVGTSNADARRECWLGEYHLKNRRGKESLDLAVRHFEAAIAKEPAYAEAHAGRAESYALMNVVAYGKDDTREVMSKALRAANDALDLNPRLAQARNALANVYMKYYWDWQGAEEQFKLAISLDANYAAAHYGYSRLLTIRGRFDEAVAEALIARRLDPFSASTILNHCRTIFFSGRFEESLQCYDKLVADHPDYSMGPYSRALVQFQLGKYDDAIAVFEGIYSKDRALGGGILGYFYGQRGRRADAERVLNQMLPLLKENLPEHEIALIYAGLGDLDNATLWWEKSLEVHFDPFSFVLVDPMFQKLRTEPKFISLVKKYEA